MLAARMPSIMFRQRTPFVACYSFPLEHKVPPSALNFRTSARLESHIRTSPLPPWKHMRGGAWETACEKPLGGERRLKMRETVRSANVGRQWQRNQHNLSCRGGSAIAAPLYFRLLWSISAAVALRHVEYARRFVFSPPSSPCKESSKQSQG